MSRPTDGPPLVRTGVVFYALLLLAAWIWASWAGDPLFYASTADQQRGADPLRDLGAGVLAGAIVIAVSAQVSRHTGWGEDLARVLARALGPLSIWNCVVLALASGVAEEAFFRGALQPRVGYLGASVLFGLAHFVPRREFLPWTAFSVAAGFLLGGLFAATGNLLAPVVAHVLINAVNLRLLTTRYR